VRGAGVAVVSGWGAGRGPGGAGAGDEAVPVGVVAVVPGSGGGADVRADVSDVRQAVTRARSPGGRPRPGRRRRRPGSRRRCRWVLAQEAYGLYYGGDLRRAVEVARQAQGLARRTPSVGAVLALALEARARAALGDAGETRRALSRAEVALGALAPGSVTASAFRYSESQFRFHEGNAYTRLRDIRPARRAQEGALELCPPRKLKRPKSP